MTRAGPFPFFHQLLVAKGILLLLLLMLLLLLLLLFDDGDSVCDDSNFVRLCLCL